MEADRQADLERRLDPFLKGLGNKMRRRMCPAYITGLIRPEGRKSIQPMAVRAGAISYDRLHHFIGAGFWDSAPLETVLWGKQIPSWAGRKPG
jgi:SRSO17 transposase